VPVLGQEGGWSERSEGRGVLRDVNDGLLVRDPAADAATPYLTAGGDFELPGKIRVMTRDEAWKLVCEFTPSESLRRHMLSVEAVMLHFAEQSNEPDLEKWAVTGLLHDFDYESHPDLGPEGHPFWGVNYLRQNTDLPEDVLEAILGHYREGGVVRVTPLAQTLFAVDELSGLITAAALVRPDKSVMNLEVSSIMKKMKDKAFAKGVNREDIRTGAAELGLEVEKLVSDVLVAMQTRADALGLGLREP
jgi:predicted hydrolase (HD superfamily)